MTAAAPLLEMRGIVRSFPGVLALRGVDLTLRAAKCWPCWAKTAPARARS